MYLQRINYVNNLQYKSYALKRSLETYPKNLVEQNYKLAVERYNRFLDEKIKNPISAKLAMKKVLKEHPVENQEYYNENLALLEKDNQIKEKLEIISNQEAQYQKTFEIREKLLAENRIDLIRVKPKLTGFKKLMLKFKMLF